MSEAPELAGCDHYGGALSVHHSARGIVRRQVLKCWTCERRTPFVVRWDGAYYGTTEWCVVCLDGWVDGYRMERPFRPRWKVERAAEIKAKWDDAMLPARYRAWTRYDIHTATCWEEGPCAECDARPS